VPLGLVFTIRLTVATLGCSAATMVAMTWQSSWPVL